MSLVYFNRLQWDVRTTPEYAKLDGASAYMNTDILGLPICAGGTLELLLPVVQQTSAAPMEVYFQETIRKKKITFGDVLYTIYRFYNMTPLLPTDITYIALAENMKETVENLLQAYSQDRRILKQVRFVHFLFDHTTFIGLTKQDNGIYSLSLGKTVGM